MSIYGPEASGGDGELGDYAKTTYVDTQDGLQVLRAGDSMMWGLQMGGNIIRGLPTAYPPHLWRR
jgi:hypothetical protein